MTICSNYPFSATCSSRDVQHVRVFPALFAHGYIGLNNPSASVSVQHSQMVAGDHSLKIIKLLTDTLGIKASILDNDTMGRLLGVMNAVMKAVMKAVYAGVVGRRRNECFELVSKV